MFDFEDEEEQVDQEQLARDAAESLTDSDWKTRFGACRTLEAAGAAAAPHAKILYKLSMKDKEADVRKAAQGVLSALQKSGAELPAGYMELDDEDDAEKQRERKKKEREEAWAERRKQREKEWEEKQKLLDEQDKMEEERRRREDQALYAQYEYVYSEEPSQPSAGADAAQGASSFSAAAGASPAGVPTAFRPADAEPAYKPGRSRGSVFSSFRPAPRPKPGAPNPNPVIHPAYAPRQEDQEFEIEPESDTEEIKAAERAERLKELQEKQQQAEEKRRQKEEQKDRVPETVPWEGHRVNFRIFTEVLPMRVDHEKMTPLDFAEIWEKQWGVAYADHVKFEAPGESARKFLHPRDEVVPLHPSVVTLHNKAGSVLNALATALREYGALAPEEAQALRVHKLEQTLANVEKRQKAQIRERERLHVKETRARARTGTYQDRQDKRVQEMRGIVNKALGIQDSLSAPTGRPERQMRELKRPDQS